MTQQLSRLSPRAVEKYAGDAIWETNGGIYLGQALQAGCDEALFPLEELKLEAMREGCDFRVGDNQAVKSWWPLNGDIKRFGGNRHLITIGANGSGKTRKILLPNLFKLRDWSIVAIDPKGELCAHTAIYRKRHGNKIIVVDPYGVMEKNYKRLFDEDPDLFTSHGFNALAAINPQSDSFADDAAEIATALVKNDNARDPYWTMAAQALIKGVIMALKIKYGDEADLNLLRQVIGSEPEKLAQNYIVPTIEKYKKDWASLVASLGEFTKYSPDDRELSGIRRTAKAHTDWLDSVPMQKDLKKGNIDAAAMKARPTTVYLILPPKEIAKKAVWLRLLITSLLVPLMDSAEVQPGQVPVLFMLEEFAALGQMEVIKQNYAMLRQYGIKLWTIWQGLKQASELYGEWWENFIQNAGATQTFATTDMTTREYMSKLCGERMRIYRTFGTSTNRGGGSSYGIGNNMSFSNNSGTSSTTGEQRMNERRVKPHELAALDDDETLIYHRRGTIHLSVCPQPELLGGKICEALREARALIEGREAVAPSGRGLDHENARVLSGGR